MANWKFTDEYGAGYPELAKSILNVLVFDVPSGSPVKDGRFSAALDLAATGKDLGVLEKLLGVSTVAISGTVTSADAKLTINLGSTDNAAILKALVEHIPLVGTQLTAADLRIQNTTTAAATSDRFEIGATIKIGAGAGELVMQIPLSAGTFGMGATFSDFGVSLADLNFLVPGDQFSGVFPSDLPTTYYRPDHTKLKLLSLRLTLKAQTTPAFKIGVDQAAAAIGIVNIPLYPNALFLNPLSVEVAINDPLGKPKPGWSLTAVAALYPYGKQSSPPVAPPDFTYTLALQMPAKAEPTFEVTGKFSDPKDLPVSQILCDLMNSGTFDTGIGSQLTLKKFDFKAAAKTATGEISEFSVEIGMNAAKTDGKYFGLFDGVLGVKDVSIAVVHDNKKEAP